MHRVILLSIVAFTAVLFSQETPPRSVGKIMVGLNPSPPEANLSLVSRSNDVKFSFGRAQQLYGFNYMPQISIGAHSFSWSGVSEGFLLVEERESLIYGALELAKFWPADGMFGIGIQSSLGVGYANWDVSRILDSRYRPTQYEKIDGLSIVASLGAQLKVGPLVAEHRLTHAQKTNRTIQTTAVGMQFNSAKFALAGIGVWVVSILVSAVLLAIAISGF